MTRRRPRTLVGLSLCVLLVSPNLVSAAELAPSDGIILRLEGALSGTELIQTDTRDELPRAKPMAQLDPKPTTDRALAAKPEGSIVWFEPQLETRASHRGWFKKRWYIPVLVGLAAGIALLDDGSDDPADVD